MGERLLASSGDFWNRKPPSQWTAEEIDRLITKSPWAKEVKAEYLSNPNSECGGGRGVWSEHPPISRPIGFPSLGGGGSKGVKSEYVATVRWESAEPIRLALKTKLTDVFSKHYVISVSGLPLTGGDDCKASTAEDDLKSLKQFATLGATHADVIERQVSASSNFLFGFPKAAITADTKEGEFVTHLGRLAVRAKFNLKEMIYSGELAL